MYIFTFTGPMGAGKTLAMSLEAKKYQQKTGCALYSNYGLKGSKPFKSFQDFLKIADEPSSILCLDECHLDIDSRNSLSNASKYFSHLAFFLRKMRCTLMLTTPLFSNVDSRFRDVTYIYVPVSKDREYFYYPIIDWQEEKLLRTLKIKKEKAFELAGSLYETFAMVTPLEYPSNKQEFELLLAELKDKTNRYNLKLKLLKELKKMKQVS
ncbi:ATP-binding protein (plasmid) [Bacillus cytotoxicus]|uniref:ATP-binding protein n=1 Tax=Bacillus cytotoxicus TaxID=580165 RepID=UPI001AEE5F2E|nr:ATP-binding protein [Bacillus cytotoxicus]QTR81100.1 ATP-binding protein [Bacillus cytotoxicus]QTR85204.1 ATP-binding protein [Bacillus cytotoxicus]